MKLPDKSGWYLKMIRPLKVGHTAKKNDCNLPKSGF